MVTRRSIRCLAVAPALLALTLTNPAAAQPGSYGFELTRVAEGVYATIRREPPGFLLEPNTVFIINERDVVVVDPGWTPASAREALAALQTLTTKPVRYVVNTHFHDDHLLGNQVYADAYPGVEFISHVHTRADMAETGVTFRKAFIEQLPGNTAMVEQALTSGSFNGTPVTPAMRVALENDLFMAQRYAAEIPGLRPILADITVTDELVLHRGERTIRIRHPGRAATRGDLIVELPEERIVITGDILIGPMPVAGGSFISDWIDVLANIRSLGATTYIPGHGSVHHDNVYLDYLHGLLTSTRDQAAEAVRAGLTQQQTLEKVDLTEFRRQFAQGDAFKRFLFTMYYTNMAVPIAYSEAGGKIE